MGLVFIVFGVIAFLAIVPSKGRKEDKIRRMEKLIESNPFTTPQMHKTNEAKAFLTKIAATAIFGLLVVITMLLYAAYRD